MKPGDMRPPSSGEVAGFIAPACFKAAEREIVSFTGYVIMRPGGEMMDGNTFDARGEAESYAANHGTKKQTTWAKLLRQGWSVAPARIVVHLIDA